MEKWLSELLPIQDVEHDCMISRQGDVTIVFRAVLPEVFTQSDDHYEALHQGLIKAIKILPKDSIFHKQDWFVQARYQSSFEGVDQSFLTRSSDRFFNERPFLQHDCYIYLTKKPAGRKPSSSVFSSLLRTTLVPAEVLQRSVLQDFEDSAGQFQRIVSDSGIRLERLGDQEIVSDRQRVGLVERYCTLGSDPGQRLLKDLQLKDGLQIGDQYAQLYTLSDVQDLPALCGSRINYDKYSTDRTKFPVGFASTLGLLLPCNHVYNQYIFIGDPSQTMKQLEGKRLRLQSLAAYSRENAIARDAVGDFLNECVREQRLPVKAHFNVLVWSDSRHELKELKNLVTSSLAQMEATAKLETAGAAQIWWAGIPGNAADFPMNDTFDTFAEQACCFLNLETNYQDSISPVGIRLGDRLTGKPVHVDISDEPVRRGICTNRNKFILGPSGACRAIS